MGWTMSRLKATMPAVALIDGCRTPFLRSNMGFSDLTSYDLARLVLQGMAARMPIDVEDVERVIMGTVVSNITTSNVARDAMLGAGYAYGTPAFTVSQACISANVAISMGWNLIASGQVSTALCGGTESLSDIPIRYRKKMRKKLIASQKYPGWKDYLSFPKGLSLKDYLPEIPSISEFSTGRTMGEDADLMAAKFEIDRESQDQYAMESHLAAAKAAKDCLLQDDILPVYSIQNAPVLADNGIRPDTTLPKLAKLKPAFIRPYGTVTAGNASFLTDGAAAVLLMSEKRCQNLQLSPLAWLIDEVFTAQNTEDSLLLGPAYAIGKLLKKLNIALTDIDVFEIHEAFAGQVLANLACLNSESWCKTELGWENAVGSIPREKLNTQGGSLSLGHPFGATGARLVKTAARRLHQENGNRALVAACAAGGQGHALLLERDR